MCRAGGRRCPGCHGSSARSAHNARRRRNRELKREIVERAEAGGADREVLEQLRAGPPELAKRWAAENGLSARFHPGAGHTPAAAAERASGARHEPGEARRVPRPAVAGDLGRLGGREAGVGDVPPAPEPAPRPVWMSEELAAQIDTARSRVGAHRDERSLLAGVPVFSTTASGGTNETTRVVLDNGMVGYHKPFDGVDDDIASGFGQDSAQQQVHEVAAWVVARELGEPWQSLVPPVVVAEVHGRLGSLALERPGVQRRAPSAVAAQDRAAAAFFDALIGQQDRHPSNYLVCGDRVALIDHGYAFARPGDYLNFSFFQATRLLDTEQDPPGPLLRAGEVDALDRLLASPDSWGLDGLLEPERLAAMRRRAKAMRETGRLLDPGTYG